MAATRAFRLIPLSARAKLSTSRWLGVRSSGFLQKKKMVRLLRLRPERAGKKRVKAGIRVPATLNGRLRNKGCRINKASFRLNNPAGQFA